MCLYTGRYVASHGSSYNGVPLRVGEMTLGDHLRPLGLRTALIGKTHITEDREGITRLGIDRQSLEGVFAAECGFGPNERDDGLWPDEVHPRDLAYNRWMRENGYDGYNPWHTSANAAQGEDGSVKSGWLSIALTSGLTLRQATEFRPNRLQPFERIKPLCVQGLHRWARREPPCDP